MPGLNKRILYLLVFIFSFLYLLFFIPGFQTIQIYTAVNIFTSIVYIILCWFIYKHEISVRDVILFTALAIIIRLIFLNFSPIGSDDIYRYMWDGKLQQNGINPYLYTPNDSKLSFLHTDILPSKVNFRDMKTIYFPLSQWLFYVGYLLSGENVWGYKLLLFIAELITIYSLFSILKQSRLDEKYILFYVLCPLPIIHFAIDAHLDGLGLPLLLLFLLFYLKGKKIISLIFLGLSFSIKPVGLVFLPVLFLTDKNFTNRLKVILIPLFIFFIQFVPYIFNSNPFEAFIIYTENWTFNGIIFDIINMYFHNNQRSRLICGILLVVFLIPIYFGKKSFNDKIYYSALFMMIFSPVVHPWYIGWIAVLLPLSRKWSGLLLTALCSFTSFTVLNYQLNGVWKEYWLVLLIEYLPVFIFLLWEMFKRRDLQTA